MNEPSQLKIVKYANPKALKLLRQLTDDMENGTATGFTGIIEMADGCYAPVIAGNLKRLELIGALFELMVARMEADG
jgi:hypothetical protein